MRTRLRRAFESDGLGWRWHLAWWLPFAAALVLAEVTNYSHRVLWRVIELALFAVSGVLLLIAGPLVVRHRRRSGWTKVKQGGRWRWRAPGQAAGEDRADERESD